MMASLEGTLVVVGHLEVETFVAVVCFLGGNTCCGCTF